MPIAAGRRAAFGVSWCAWGSWVLFRWSSVLAALGEGRDASPLWDRWAVRGLGFRVGGVGAGALPLPLLPVVVGAARVGGGSSSSIVIGVLGVVAVCCVVWCCCWVVVGRDVSSSGGVGSLRCASVRRMIRRAAVARCVGVLGVAFPDRMWSVLVSRNIPQDV